MCGMDAGWNSFSAAAGSVPCTRNAGASAKPRLRSVRWLITTCLVAGCAHTVPIDATLPRPLVEPLPVAVGVYYGPEFRDYEHVHTLVGFEFKFLVGPQSVALFDQVFAHMFEKAVPVQDRPPLPAGEAELAAVIEPRIENFSTDGGRHLWEHVTVTYHMTLYSPQGDQLASWTVEGTGGSQYRLGRGIGLASEATHAAMRDAAVNLITGFRSQPDVRQWLQTMEIAPSRWSPKRTGMEDTGSEDR